MAQSLEQFTKHLLASGLPFAGEFEAFLKSLPAEKLPADGEQCARMLVREQKLTAYQAQEIYAGRGKKLVLANYVLHDKLGQGGMGMVLKAEHKRMGRMVALKVMSAAGMRNADAVKRFHREVQAAARLTHPNIVRAFDADEAGGQHFLVMEYVEGSDLSQLVKTNGPLSVEKALHCILQAAEGLEFAHEAGVVHRDIKPANLLLNAEGMVKILDMGLARLEHTAEQAELTGTGQIMGTVDYMAPEQALSTRSADHRADIYSLGITLWYLLTGRVAYEGETLMAKLLAHSSGPIPSLAAVNPNVPPALEAVFRRMVAKTPADRYPSMSEVIAALQRCRSGDSDAAPTVQLPSEDSKLSDFLRNLGSGQPGRSGIGASGTAVAAPVASPSAAFEQTINSSGAHSDTDPQTPNQAAARSAPAPAGVPASGPKGGAKPWHSDWRVWAIGGGVGGVLLMGLTAFLLSRGGNPSKPPVAKPAGTPPAVAGQPVSYALRFDGVDDIVELSTLTRSFNGPYTVEARVKLLRRDREQVLLMGPTCDLAWLPLGVGQWKAAYAQMGQPRTLCQREDASSEVHLAAVFDGQGPYVYVNGKRTGATSRTSVTTWAEFAWILGAARAPGVAATRHFEGELDELRVSTVARYTADFPLSGLPDRFTPDKDTLALYHFDEGTGDVLKDSSGNNHHGKIVGAKWIAASPGSAPGKATAADAAWLTRVKALPPFEQVGEVGRKLIELNPGFDGNMLPSGTAPVGTALTLTQDQLADLSPLAALTQLESLVFTTRANVKSPIADLAPLRGLKLKVLRLNNSLVADLAPLAAMPLEDLRMSSCKVASLEPLRAVKTLKKLDVGFQTLPDLGPLRGLALEYFYANRSGTADLAPLGGMPLAHLVIQGTFHDLSPLRKAPLRFLHLEACRNVRDFSALAGMPLEELHVSDSAMRDLSFLANAPLRRIGLRSMRVTDLSPLQATKVEDVSFPVHPLRDAPVLRKMASLKKLNGVAVPKALDDLEAAGKIYRRIAPGEWIDALASVKLPDDGSPPWSQAAGVFRHPNSGGKQLVLPVEPAGNFDFELEAKLGRESLRVRIPYAGGSTVLMIIPSGGDQVQFSLSVDPLLKPDAAAQAAREKKLARPAAEWSKLTGRVESDGTQLKVQLKLEDQPPIALIAPLADLDELQSPHWYYVVHPGRLIFGGHNDVSLRSFRVKGLAAEIMLLRPPQVMP